MKYLYTAEIIVFIIDAENSLDFLTSVEKNELLYIYAELFKISVTGHAAFYNFQYK